MRIAAISLQCSPHRKPEKGINKVKCLGKYGFLNGFHGTFCTSLYLHEIPQNDYDSTIYKLTLIAFI